MKKGLAIIVSLCVLCAAFSAQAMIYLPESISEFDGLPPNPHLSFFAVLRAWPDPENDQMMTVQLSEPVDELYVNWLGYNEEPQRLELDSFFRASFLMIGHKYQPGAGVNIQYNRLINLNSRAVIPFGASERQIEAARESAERFVNQYCPCVTVERPHWELRRILDNGSYCVVTSYDQDYPTNCIDVPSDAVLVAVNGVAYAWHQEFLASDGGPNDAYLTLQKGWHVVYDRTGNIQYFYKILENMNYFGLGAATAIVRYEKLNGDWHCRQVTEMYEDGSAITAYYSKTGNGKLVNAESQGITDEIWPSWRNP